MKWYLVYFERLWCIRICDEESNWTKWYLVLPSIFKRMRLEVALVNNLNWHKFQNQSNSNIKTKSSRQISLNSYMERSTFCMERSNSCMERSDFDYGAKWLLVGAKWPWGKMTVIQPSSSCIYCRKIWRSPFFVRAISYAVAFEGTS